MGNDTKIKADTIAVENNNKAKTLDNVLGNLSDLNTINKDSLVGAINELLPVVLYESDTHRTNITLNDNATNYKYFDIYTTDTEKTSFIRVENPNGKSISVSVPTVSNDQNEVQFRNAIFKIQNNKITSYKQKALSFRQGSVGLWDSPVYIYKVEGYK